MPTCKSAVWVLKDSGQFRSIQIRPSAQGAGTGRQAIVLAVGKRTVTCPYPSKSVGPECLTMNECEKIEPITYEFEPTMLRDSRLDKTVSRHIRCVTCVTASPGQKTLSFMQDFESLLSIRTRSWLRINNRIVPVSLKSVPSCLKCAPKLVQINQSWSQLGTSRLQGESRGLKLAPR